MQLTKVAKTRLRLLHKNVQDLGGRVERKELTVINFLLTVIPRLAEKIPDKNDEQLKIANDALLYLRRRGGGYRLQVVNRPLSAAWKSGSHEREDAAIPRASRVPGRSSTY